MLLHLWGKCSCHFPFLNNSMHLYLNLIAFLAVKLPQLLLVSHRVGDSSSPIWLDDLMCRFGVARLVDCSHGGIGKHNCNHGRDVWLTCSPSKF